MCGVISSDIFQMIFSLLIIHSAQSANIEEKREFLNLSPGFLYVLVLSHFTIFIISM